MGRRRASLTGFTSPVPIPATKKRGGSNPACYYGNAQQYSLSAIFHLVPRSSRKDPRPVAIIRGFVPVPGPASARLALRNAIITGVKLPVAGLPGCIGAFEIVEGGRGDHMSSM